MRNTYRHPCCPFLFAIVFKVYFCYSRKLLFSSFFFSSLCTLVRKLFEQDPRGVRWWWLSHNVCALWLKFVLSRTSLLLSVLSLLRVGILRPLYWTMIMRNLTREKRKAESHCHRCVFCCLYFTSVSTFSSVSGPSRRSVHGVSYSPLCGPTDCARETNNQLGLEDEAFPPTSSLVEPRSVAFPASASCIISQ